MGVRPLPGHPPKDLGCSPQRSPSASSSSAGRSSVSKKSLELHLVISLAKTSSLSDRSSAEAGGKRGWGGTPLCLHSHPQTASPPSSLSRDGASTVGIEKFLFGAVLRVPGNVLHPPLRQALRRHAPCHPQGISTHSPLQRPRSCPTAPPWSCTQTPQGDLGPSLCQPEFLQEIQDHPWVTQGPFKKPCTRPGTPRAPAQETQARQNSPLTHLLWRTAASRA